mmetsp:Transcript_7950/g.36219  ORF Transcript_7950/g.36219 Transcript_7950/m.36219 type:complete len:305 (-) Transcript_7950:919-1833(-)
MQVGCGVRRRGSFPRDAAGPAFRTPFRAPSRLVDPRGRLHRRRDSTRGRARVLRHRGTGGFRSGGRRGGGVGEGRFVRVGSFAGIRRTGRVRRRSPSIGRRRRARARAMDHRDVVRARPGPVPGRPVHPAGRREGSAGRDPRRRASVVGHRFIFTSQTRGAPSRPEGCVRRRRRVRPRALRETRRRDRGARRRARGGAHGGWKRRGGIVRVRLPDQRIRRRVLRIFPRVQSRRAHHVAARAGRLRHAPGVPRPVPRRPWAPTRRAAARDGRRVTGGWGHRRAREAGICQVSSSFDLVWAIRLTL